jgi:hypothetical protein
MNNVVPFKTKDNTFIKTDAIQKNEFWEEQGELRQQERNRFKIIAIESKIINKDSNANLVLFEDFEGVKEYEDLECGDEGCFNSWRSCKHKFKDFPCQMFVRFTRSFKGFVAEYMTKEEYRADLLKSLAQIS